MNTTQLAHNDSAQQQSTIIPNLFEVPQVEQSKDLPPLDYKVKIKRPFSGGIDCETMVEVHGYTWIIFTTKQNNGHVVSHAKRVEVHKSNGMMSINYGTVLGTKSPDEYRDLFTTSIKISRLTESIALQCHNTAIEAFNKLYINGELPKKEAEYKIGIGQVFVDFDGSKSVLFEFVGEDRKIGKLANLSGRGTTRCDLKYVREISKKFGIGTYYIKGEIMSLEETQEIAQKALEADKIKEAEEKAKTEEENRKAKELSDYLAQFKKADKRTTTNLIKRYILEKYPTVSKVEVKSDSFSGGDSIDVTYHAPEEIQEIQDLRFKLNYGSFDAMNDIYEHSNKSIDSVFVYDGYVLETYKYASVYYEHSDEVRQNTNITASSSTGNVSGVDGCTMKLNQAKDGVELYFSKKPSSDILDKVRSCGFRWSKYQAMWYAKQSPRTLDLANELSRTNSTKNESDGGMGSYIDDVLEHNYFGSNS